MREGQKQLSEAEERRALAKEARTMEPKPSLLLVWMAARVLEVRGLEAGIKCLHDGVEAGIGLEAHTP